LTTKSGPEMNIKETDDVISMDAIDIDADREDDFTGPPVTSAEVALLQQVANVLGELSLIAGERAKAAARPVTAVRSEAAAKTFAEQSELSEMLARGMRLPFDCKAKLVMNLQTWHRRNGEAARSAEERSTTAARERRQAQQEKATAIVVEIVSKAEGDLAGMDAKKPIRRWFAERDHERGLADLPVGEVVALLCRDINRVVNWQDYRDRPWAADAEALFRRMAAQAEKTGAEKTGAEKTMAEKTTAAQAAPAEPGADPVPPEATAPEPPAEAAAAAAAGPASEVPTPPQAPASAEAPATPEAPPGLRPDIGADPPERYAHLDRSRPEVRAFLAERGYRTA